MAKRAHSRATRLAATFLARLASPDVAAATFRVDVRTVRAWQAGAVELPEDQWTAIRDVLQARGAEMAAKGETRGLVPILTAAGIADRNVRYSTLIERREARRAAEQAPEPTRMDAIREAVAALASRQQTLVSLEVRAAIEASLSRDEDHATVSEEEGDAAFLAYLGEVANLSEDELSARLEAAYAARPQEREPGDPLASLRDAIDEIDGPAGDGTRPPAVSAAVVEEPVPEAALEAPQRPPRPVLLPTYEDAPDAWNPWARIEQ